MNIEEWFKSSGGLESRAVPLSMNDMEKLLTAFESEQMSPAQCREMLNELVKGKKEEYETD